MEALHALLDPKVTGATVVAFILLWIVLAKFLFKPVLGLLDSREQDIKNTYGAAENKLSEAEQFRADYEKRLAEIEAEARSRILAAVKEGQDAKDQILAEAKTRAEEIVTRGQEDLEREREKLLAQLRDEVVTISLSAAGKLVGESMDDDKHRRLIGDFINKIGAEQ